MNISKKALSVILATLIVGCSSATAFAVQDETAETVSTQAISVSGVGGIKTSDNSQEVGGANVLIGDVNLDGKISCADAVLLQKYVVKKVTLSITSMAASNVNDDSAVNINDVVSIQKFLSAHSNYKSTEQVITSGNAVTRYYVDGVSISKTKLDLTKGSTETLTSAVSPQNATTKAVKWSSSDTAVATVDANGKVTAVDGGTCTISCQAIDGSNAKAACAVTVAVPVTSVELNAHSLKFLVGKSAPFYPKVNPTNATTSAVKFTSSDERIAKVGANNMLIAVGPGTCIITCTSTDGTEKYDTCKIIVSQPATKISINKSTASVDVNKTVSLSGTASPSNVTNGSISWKSSNTSIATVSSSGVVTGKKAGTATITCSTSDGTNLSASCKVTVKETISKGQQIANYAAQWVGVTPYVWGGTSLTYGADCSGFVCSIYSHFGYDLWGNRTTLSNEGYGVSLSNAKPGDIVVFYGHVGIYAGNGMVTHALNETRGTMTTDISWGGTVKCVRRIVD